MNPVSGIYGGIGLAFLGVSLTALGILLVFRLDGWKRRAGVLVALAGGIVVFGGLRAVLAAFSVG